MIKGITVTLYNRTQSGTDGFGEPIYTEVGVTVNDVLVSPASVQEVLDTHNLYGRKAVYTLAIPKGDTHTWENAKVKFFGEYWRVFGIPQEGIDANIPLRWNKKLTVERYE